MTYGPDPYARDPFAPDPFAPGPGQQVVQAPPPSAPSHVLGTLSIIFAFVFAPVGALLGHIALTQDQDARGRTLALVGITLSYVFIVTALVAWGVAEAMYP